MEPSLTIDIAAALDREKTAPGRQAAPPAHVPPFTPRGRGTGRSGHVPSSAAPRGDRFRPGNAPRRRSY
ncbi:hypothetical protein [Actinorugispora endophytica]|uniref:hypothetical protein n=1 Tax=Actinorugispora endophytica TaxID=1605990 RepID=UPI00105F7B7D|nr:hypothetical protein [Actinorugispora endophytica]